VGFAELLVRALDYRRKTNDTYAARAAPLTSEDAVTEQERETAGAVRSAHVAHFFPTDWAQTAQRALGALERIDAATAAPQLIITVPDATAALALTRELSMLPPAAGLRILPVTGATRATRLLAETPAPVIVGTPSTLGQLIAGSHLKLANVHTIILGAADEYETEIDALATLMAELPKTASRVLTAASATPLVENVLERYFHRARRITADAPLPLTFPLATPPTIHLYPTAPGAPLAPLTELLDEFDSPSTAIVVNDTRSESQARSALAALGYEAGSPLVTVTRGDVAPYTSLVLFVGTPSMGALATALSAHPARMVAMVSARQRAALEKMAAGVIFVPFERSRAARAARARDGAMRATLRGVLAAGFPAREVLALEPLLTEHDGLAIAAAALRLYEQARNEIAAAKQAGRDELREEQKAAKAAAAPAAEDRPRSGDRGSRPFSGPRDRDRGSDRNRTGDRGERAPRGDKPSFGGPPRGDKPSFGGPPRGDKPSYGGPPRGDKPFERGPRPDRDTDRGPRSGPPRRKP